MSDTLPQTSAINEAEDGLLELLKARKLQRAGPLVGTAIDLGDPGGNLKVRHVWIAETLDSTQSWEISGAGAQQRREEFDMAVHVFVELAGNRYASLRDAAQALVEEVASTVRADPTLGGAVWHAQVGGISRATGATAKGRGAEMIVRVSVLAFVIPAP